MTAWTVGNRCSSLGEPALGLGIIKIVNSRQIQVHFPASDVERLYAAEKAPLRRVLFLKGDLIRDADGMSYEVLEVREQNGIAFYLTTDTVIPETHLDPAFVFSRPDQQLLAGMISRPREFDLRHRAWKLLCRNRSSRTRGLVGPRIELLPHQIYIANEVATRHNPRVLLSDEVGLGKTIEAGLIFHRLWVTGTVKRVLCLTPSHLVNQWLTEFYRKFNTLFHIMTPMHAEELKKSQGLTNPFLAYQVVIQDISLLSRHADLAAAALEGEWDLVIIDEAHHLYWSEHYQAPEYQLAEALSRVVPGMLLLTATPRQLGMESHFGRLRLLDPDRFSDFDRFKRESDDYQKLAKLVDEVMSGKLAGLKKELRELYPEDPDLLRLAPEAHSAEEVDPFIRALIDRHGTGRTVFRNRRRVLQGFPARVVRPAFLEPGAGYLNFMAFGLGALRDTEWGQRILAGAPAFSASEFKGKPLEVSSMLKKAWRDDPRLPWLLKLLRDEPNEKFLLICSNRAVVLALQEWLALTPGIEVSVFHEELSLIERDRQAAYFSRPEGARVLLCSEIGSEGRNFQFAGNLVLFDLPLNPALLEQRIGRLDRIGQKRDIQIHVPCPKATPLANLYRWYQEGLDAFANHLVEGDYLYEHLREKIFTIFNAVNEPESFEPFLEESRRFVESAREVIEQGRDHLQELNSFNREKASELVRSIAENDENPELEDFMEDIFELFGVEVEEQDSQGIQILTPSPQMQVESFPGLSEDGMEITYRREVAVAREDVGFLSFDHPMVTGALDLFLGMDRGATAFCVWKGAPQPGILLQCLYVLEAANSDATGLESYLPPLPILVSVDQNRKLRPDLGEKIQDAKLEKGPIAKLQQQNSALSDIVASLLSVAEEEAHAISDQAVTEAENRAMNALKEEYDRLKALRRVNPGVRQEELEIVEERLNQIMGLIEDAKTRLDGIRLVFLMPTS